MQISFSGLLSFPRRQIPFGRCEASFVTRSSTQFISIGVQFSFKGVFDPVRGICVAAARCVCERAYSVVFISLWPLLSLLHFRNRRYKLN